MCCGLQRGPSPHWESRGNRGIWPLYHFLRAWRFFFAAFAPSLPSAVRVALDRCATVRFFFATAAAFLMFFLAAAFCAACHTRRSDMRPRVRLRTDRRFENRTPPVLVKERTLGII